MIFFSEARFATAAPTALAASTFPVEAIFKSFARALKESIKIVSDEVSSSKGVL